MTQTAAESYRRRYTREADNVGHLATAGNDLVDPALLELEDEGGFFDLLAEQSFSLAVTREYEHLLLLLDGSTRGRIQSAFPLPHPSGLCFDASTRELVVSSTRTPNFLLSMSPYRPTPESQLILPVDFERAEAEEGVLFLPRHARFLPGSLYIHDVVQLGGAIYATITGHNFLAKLDLETGWERVWWPAVIDSLGANGFNANYLQLNSMAAGKTPADSFYTGFSAVVSEVKPWKQGFGPLGRGVVFAGETRAPILTGLTCPHSAKLVDGQLWLCNSGFGTFGYVDGLNSEAARYVAVGAAPGFTRGLAFGGDYVFVGLSRVIESYEAYAPGLDASGSKCGIWAFNRHDGRFVASLSWPNGYQIYDVQTLPGVKNPRLPLAPPRPDGVNHLLRYLG